MCAREGVACGIREGVACGIACDQHCISTRSAVGSTVEEASKKPDRIQAAASATQGLCDSRAQGPFLPHSSSLFCEIVLVAEHGRRILCF